MIVFELNYKMVHNSFHKGWLKSSKFKNDNIQIPATTKVEIISNSLIIDKVIILEGIHKNKFTSFNRMGDKSFFKKHITNNNDFYLTLKKDKLVLGETIITNLICDVNIFNSKKYFIGIPDYPHSKTSRFLNELNNGSRFANSWFPIFNSNKFKTISYLHFGSFSEGCITVIKNKNKPNIWSQIHSEIMKKRSDKSELINLFIR